MNGDEPNGVAELDAELDTVERFIALDDWDGLLAWYAHSANAQASLSPIVSGDQLSRVQQRLQQVVSLLQARQDEVASWIAQLDQTQTCMAKLSRAYRLDDPVY